MNSKRGTSGLVRPGRDKAEVYVNGRLTGMTERDGTRLVPELRSGDRIIARKLIHENPTSRPS